MVENGKQIAAALRHLDSHGQEEGSRKLAETMAYFLVDRAESRHAGWRVLRQVIVDSASDAPWEKCARRAVPLIADDLIHFSDDRGRTPLHRAQHVAAERRAEMIAPFVEPGPVLKDLGLVAPRWLSDEQWAAGLSDAVRARSREGVGRRLQESLGLDWVDDQQPTEERRR
ncbi:MAG: hypothetical protein REI11_09865 [Patulibacter sp.]|nr:hypothetical protein [Patulibacter sp.]